MKQLGLSTFIEGSAAGDLLQGTQTTSWVLLLIDAAKIV